MEGIYPKRDKFFAMRAIRTMIKSCASHELGPDGCYLVSIIATTEDSAKYRRPVTYYDEQLANVLGVSRFSLVRIRTRVVAHGWLYYKPGRKGVPGRYWVTIPTFASDLPDNPSDEGILCDGATESDKYSVTPPHCNRTESALNPHCNRTESAHLSNRIPEPEPIPPPKAPKGGGEIESIPIPEELDDPLFHAAWADWRKHRREIRKKLTPQSVKQQLFEMSGWGVERSVLAIRHSIARGWQGIFEPRQNHQKPTQFSGIVEAAKAHGIDLQSPHPTSNEVPF